MKYIKNHSTNVVLQVMICARTATIVSADDINDFDTLEEEDQEKLRAMVKEINETRGDKALKKAWKASVAHLKPQKKKKKTAAAATSTLRSSKRGCCGRSLAKSMVARYRHTAQ